MFAVLVLPDDIPTCLLLLARAVPQVEILWQGLLHSLPNVCKPPCRRDLVQLQYLFETIRRCYSASGEIESHACSPGQYFNPRSKNCVTCSAGYYSKSPLEECKKCPGGMYSFSGNAACQRCPSRTKVKSSRTVCIAVA